MKREESVNPYPGLRPFREDESHLFFGREGQSQAILTLLQRERFAAVVGVSGCGKSSLVKAGLFPVIYGGLLPSIRGGWKIASLRPGSTPITNLAKALADIDLVPAQDSSELYDEAAVIETSLRRSTHGLSDLMEQATLAGQPSDLLVLVDQFEEIFRYRGEMAGEERDHFVRLLIEAVHQTKWPIHILITMRSDFLGDCAQFRDLPELINRAEYLVPRMTREERREAIEGPAAVEDVEVAPRLLNRLLDDMGDDPDQLPVLQHALRRSWVAWVGRGISNAPLDLTDYEMGGTLQNALSEQAGDAFNNLNLRQQEIAEALFRTITQKGEDNRGVRRPTRLATISEIAKATLQEVIDVIDVFRDPELSFLLPPAEVPLTSESLIDISHESLMRNWKTLTVWVDDEAKNADDYWRMVDSAERWKQGNADPLLDLEIGRMRVMAQDKASIPAWTGLHATPEQAAITAEFWQASLDSSAKRKSDRREAEQRERQRAEEELRREEETKRHELERENEVARQELKRRKSQRKIGMVVMAALLGLVAWALAERSASLRKEMRAIKAEVKATSRALALNAIDALHQNPELALLLSIEAALTAFPDPKITEHGPREIEMALRTATGESLIRRRFEGHTSKVYSIDFDHEGRRLLTSGAIPDSTARIWDADTAREIGRIDLGTMPEGKTTASCARFSPDGRRIVTTTYRQDGAVYVWDAEQLRNTEDGAPRVVNVPLVKFNEHRARVTTAAFSPDGKLVASGGYDNLIRLWDAATGKEVCMPLGSSRTRHSKRVRSVVFDGDGGRLLSTSDDGTAILWDVRAAMGAGTDPFTPDSKEVIQVFIPPSAEMLNHGDLSPSGKWVATAGYDRKVRIWNAATGVQVAARDHPDSVMYVEFIDDDHLVTACNDSALRFWELGNASDESIGSFHPAAQSVKVLQLVATQKGHQGWIRGLAVSPERRFVASCGDDGTARLWKIPPGGETAVLGMPQFFSWAADIHYGNPANGQKRLISYSGTDRGEVRAVNPFTERSLDDWGPLAGDQIWHTAEIRSLTVSPDGTSIVTASGDQTAIVWDARTGRPKFQITGHQGPKGGTIFQARYSPDGRRILTASSEGSTRVWDATTGAAKLLILPDRREFVGQKGFENPAELIAKLRKPPDVPSVFVESEFTDEERAKLIDPTADLGLTRQLVADVLNRLIREAALGSEPAFRAVACRPSTSDLLKQPPEKVDREMLNRLLLEDAFPAELERNRVYDARFSQDGSKIVTADFDSRTATVWDARDARKLMSFRASGELKDGHGDNVMSAAFSPDDTRVVTACLDGFCRIWDARSGNLVSAIPHGIAVRSAEYSSDGTLILTAATDGVARVWSARDGRLRTELRGPIETLTEARFSNEGSYIITSSRDGTARIYNAHLWGLYSLATQRVTRKLTMEERAKYGISRALTNEERAYYNRERADKP